MPFASADQAPEDFRALRDLLAAAGYTEARICARCGIAGLDAFRPREHGLKKVTDRLSLLIRLFLACGPAGLDLTRNLLAESEFRLLEQAGLIRLGSHSLRAAVLLSPVEGLWLVSDIPFAIPPDGVFPPIAPQTKQFLGCLPATPCGTFLDLCTGSGVAGLLASRYADQVWLADLSPRCAQFAEFNRKLNGIGNCSVVSGDLYEPLEELTFDRIVAHPPYVPSLGSQLAFRDGGEDGEQVMRRIIEGLPRRLKPRGEAHLRGLGSDRAGEPFAGRVRAWLGAHAREFEIDVRVHETFSPPEFCRRMAAFRTAPPEAWNELADRLRLERAFTCSLAVRRAPR